jgi:hypothetical protein
VGVLWLARRRSTRPVERARGFPVKAVSTISHCTRRLESHPNPRWVCSYFNESNDFVFMPWIIPFLITNSFIHLIKQLNLA